MKTPSRDDLIHPQLGMTRLLRVDGPENIDSDIVIDFEEAFNKFPSWRPSIVTYNGQEHIRFGWTSDKTPYCVWSDSGRSKKVAQFEDIVINADGVAGLQRNEYLEADNMLQRGQENPGKLSEDQFALLPNRLVIYALWQRNFYHVDARQTQKRLAQTKTHSITSRSNLVIE